MKTNRFPFLIRFGMLPALAMLLCAALAGPSHAALRKNQSEPSKSASTSWNTKVANPYTHMGDSFEEKPAFSVSQFMEPDNPGPGAPGKGGTDGPQALDKFLDRAIEAAGGRKRLEGIKDRYSIHQIIYGDVYKAEALLLTWSLEPDFLRRELVKDRRILQAELYDGKTLFESTGHQVRYAMGKNLHVLLENTELNRILTLLPINNNEFPATLGPRKRNRDKWIQEVRVSAPSGLLYRLFFDMSTHRIAHLEYQERRAYLGRMEIFLMTAVIEAYRQVDGVVVPEKVRLLSGEVCLVETLLLDQRFNTRLKPDFFSLERLKSDLPESMAGLKAVSAPSATQRKWKEEAVRMVLGVLERDKDCHFRKVVSYGAPDVYRERLMAPGLTLAVDRDVLTRSDASALYTELMPAGGGFYIDCILLLDVPGTPSVKAETLLHETTHAIVRRKQEEAPLVPPDDESLTKYQNDLLFLGQRLRAFEQIAFQDKHASDPQTADRAARTWTLLCQDHTRSVKRCELTPEALVQFRAWCGVNFDLERIRKHYIELGIDPGWMPTD